MWCSARTDLARISLKQSGSPSCISSRTPALLHSEIETACGSKTTPLYPIAQIILPQFSSSPKNAVLTRLEDTTERANFLASATQGALDTCTSKNFVAP